MKIEKIAPKKIWAKPELRRIRPTDDLAQALQQQNPGICIGDRRKRSAA